MNVGKWTGSGLSSVLLLSGLALFGTDGLRADNPVKLSGCLIKGDGDGGYLLVNVPSVPVAGRPANSSVVPGAVGTSGAYANVFYWIDKDDDLRQHVGHQVEIEGDSKGDVKDGELKVDRKEQWTEVEVKSDERHMKALVPNASVVAPADSSSTKLDVMVKRVDVAKVRMVAATCQ